MASNPAAVVPNQITVTGGVSEVSIFSGAGNDTVSVDSAASNLTINAGKGNDIITLNSGGHVIEYADKDGKDTIYGWSSDDTLKIAGGTSVKPELYSSNTNADDTYIINIDTGRIYFKNTPFETKINILYTDNNTSEVIAVPTYIAGTSGNDSLENTLSGATINAFSGNNTITNNANDVRISAYSDHDIVNTSGDRLYIQSGAGKDTIRVIDGEKQTIIAGTDNDFITLHADVDNAVIDGGTGSDAIYTNDKANIIQYNNFKDGGNDTIFGFNASDSIQLGEGISISVKGTGEDTVYATEVTGDGFVIHLSNRGFLILKGEAKTDGATAITDFKDLEGGTAIKVYQNGSDDITNIFVP